jgi:hypothetical protein
MRGFLPVALSSRLRPQVRVLPVVASGVISAVALIGCGAVPPAEPGQPPPSAVRAASADRAPSPEPSPTGATEEESATTTEPSPTGATAHSKPLPKAPTIPEKARPAGQVTRDAAQAAPAIREFLAERYIYAYWYPNVRTVETTRDAAVIGATIAAGHSASTTAEAICQAILGSHWVTHAAVRFATVRHSVTCS